MGYFHGGETKFFLNDYRGAITDLNKAIELDSRDKESYFLRGLSKIILGQKESGCLDLSKAGKLGFDDAYDAIRKHCN